MIDANNLRAQFETIHGDIELVVGLLKENLGYAEKLKKIARVKEDIEMADATTKTSNAMLDAMKGKNGIREFKSVMLSLAEEYPAFFERGRRDIGTSKEAVNAIIHRIEYMINRYDVKYPDFDQHRCNDRG